MKLSQLFSGDTHTENVTHPQPTPAQAAYMNRQIRSLVPGQTISGEVLSRSGGEVQIRISEDLVLNARVDRNMNIEVGKNMTFEVKNNGSSLTLSPLFTNVSTDRNVLKALDMAGLPVNRDSVEMTEQLMQAGLPVNKNILQQIFREINSFPQSEISDIITLHKLQMPVNEGNIAQMASYRNLNHQLIEGMDTVLEALPEVFDSMVARGDLPEAMKLYRAVLELVQEDQGAEAAVGPEGNTGEAPGFSEEMSLRTRPEASGIPEEEGKAGIRWIPEAGVTPEEESSGRALGVPRPGTVFPEGEEILPEKTLSAGKPTERPEEEAWQTQAPEADAAGGEEKIPLTRAGRAVLAKEALEALDSLQLPEQGKAGLRNSILQFARGQIGTGAFFSVLSSMANGARTSEAAMGLLGRLFSGREFRQLLSGQLKNSWTLTAEEVAVPGKVEEMYRRLDRQLKGLTQALESTGQTGSAAFRAAGAMSQNVDFLQQINQLYTYVQLPLRLQQGDTHGELYVYTNKRKLTSREGAVSALLHLDMENLGAVDVYVTLQNSRVNTKFYLQEEELMDFMAAHMDILTKRLKDRGYDCSFDITLRNREEGQTANSGLLPILGQEKGIALSRYAFDVRT